jgi:hypothetical protein
LGHTSEIEFVERVVFGVGFVVGDYERYGMPSALETHNGEQLAYFLIRLFFQ